MMEPYFLPPDAPLLDRFAADYRPPETLDALRETIFSHLLLVLNSRRPWAEGELPAALEDTVAGWGLPDTGPVTTRSAGDRFRLRQAIARTITAFEPRLTDVRVEDAGLPGRDERPVFRIHARIILPDGAIDLSGDTVLDITNRRFDRRKKGNLR
jgi:type VI secretion system lysozyme-like protein